MLVLLLQVGAGSGPEPAIDLSDLGASTNCPQSSATEIVVCARRVDPNAYRLPRLVPREAGPPRADIGLFGKVRGSVTIEDRSVGGVDAPAAMVRIKVPF